VVGWLSTAIADDDSEFPVCLSGRISICVQVCARGWCVVLSLRSRVTPKQPPLQLHWHCAERHWPLASADTDVVGHHDRASTRDAASGIYSRS
jgi:hypothetical protein